MPCLSFAVAVSIAPGSLPRSPLQRGIECRPPPERRSWGIQRGVLQCHGGEIPRDQSRIPSSVTGLCFVVGPAFEALSCLAASFSWFLLSKSAMNSSISSMSL